MKSSGELLSVGFPEAIRIIPADPACRAKRLE
jgi:hypothetical protein